MGQESDNRISYRKPSQVSACGVSGAARKPEREPVRAVVIVQEGSEEGLNEGRQKTRQSQEAEFRDYLDNGGCCSRRKVEAKIIADF